MTGANSQMEFCVDLFTYFPINFQQKSRRSTSLCISFVQVIVSQFWRRAYWAKFPASKQKRKDTVFVNDGVIWKNTSRQHLPLIKSRFRWFGWVDQNNRIVLGGAVYWDQWGKKYFLMGFFSCKKTAYFECKTEDIWGILRVLAQLYIGAEAKCKKKYRVSFRVPLDPAFVPVSKRNKVLLERGGGVSFFVPIAALRHPCV